ncbi:hypothetical protein C8J57DRAFT_1404888 [Mycena rebaudengoi]|nr:hypothetical protein C8J57DRAFT_1404888 [Mycena rebaudengoi]
MFCSMLSTAFLLLSYCSRTAHLCFETYAFPLLYLYAQPTYVHHCPSQDITPPTYMFVYSSTVTAARYDEKYSYVSKRIKDVQFQQ